MEIEREKFVTNLINENDISLSNIRKLISEKNQYIVKTALRKFDTETFPSL